MDILSSLKSRLDQAKTGFSTLVGNSLKTARTELLRPRDFSVPNYSATPFGRVSTAITNIGSTPIKPAKYVVDNFIVQPFMQASEKLRMQLTGESTSPQTNFAPGLYGKDPISSFSKTAKEEGVSKWLQGKGVSPDIAVPLSYVGGVGLAVSDLFPISGGTKKAGKKMVEKADDVIELLHKAFYKSDFNEAERILTNIPNSAPFKKQMVDIFAPVIEEAQAKASKVAEQVVNPQNAIQNVIKALKEAVPIRGKQEAIYTKTRAERMRLAEKAGEEAGGGMAGFKAELGALGGEMEKVDFTPLKISQGDMDGVFRAVKESDALTWWEKITARHGLAKLFGEAGGAVPTENEIALMRKSLSSEFVDAVLSKRSNLQKAYEAGVNILNVPRALMSSFDMSAPLRQGIFLIGRPKQWLPAMRDMFKYAFSEKAYENLGQEIMSRPTYSKLRDMKLAITDMGSITTREESFMSNLAERIPGIGKIVKGSNRAYSGFLTKLRADVADDLIKSAEKLGVNVSEGSKALRDIGSFVNTATGRGGLDFGFVNLEKAAPLLNSVFFSPRLMASRVNLLNPAYYVRLDPFVRKEAIKSLLTFAGIGAIVLGLIKLAGGDKVEIGDNPTSADFGKVKIGNTRYDIWGGFQQYIKLLFQLKRGELTSTTTGEKYQIKSAFRPDVKGYKPITALDIGSRFFEQKESPLFSFATGLARGTDIMGQPFDIPKEIRNRFIPMIMQDTMEILQERGAPGLLMEVPGFFGIGTQTYTTPPRKLTPTKPSSATFKKPGPTFKEGFSLK